MPTAEQVEAHWREILGMAGSAALGSGSIQFASEQPLSFQRWLETGTLADRAYIRAPAVAAIQHGGSFFAQAVAMLEISMIGCAFEHAKAFCNTHEIYRSHLEKQPWFRFARVIRNAMLHDMHLECAPGEVVEWNGLRIDETMNGQRIDRRGFLQPAKAYQLLAEIAESARKGYAPPDPDPQ